MTSLLELARSLNLVEALTVGKSTSESETNQLYNFVIAIDFEATCWDHSKKYPKWYQPEIIEFPAVLINLRTGVIESEFHQYVTPIESPHLSEFCKSFTGIQQETVDNGVPLQTCIMLFTKWLKDCITQYQLLLPKMSTNNALGNTALLSWSDWDFGVCLKRECDRKQIKRPTYFDQWIDIKTLYKEWYKYKPCNFNDALAKIGLQFIGREHSGIDDSRNIATLACRLVKDGATLKLTKDLKPFLIFNTF